MTHQPVSKIEEISLSKFEIKISNCWEWKLVDNSCVVWNFKYEDSMKEMRVKKL